MPRSIGLAAYRALSWRNQTQLNAPYPARPPGQLLWCHATTDERACALVDLQRRIQSQRDDLNLLLTLGADAQVRGAQPDGCSVVRLDSDHPAEVRGFLDHWQPDLCLWTGGDWLPNLIAGANERKLPMILTDLLASDLIQRRRWMPDLTRSCLEAFDPILLADATAAAGMRRLGVNPDRYSVQSRLFADANPQPCADEDLTAAGAELAGRPVWLASNMSSEEILPVLTAHCEALRLQHRLLLVVVLDEPDMTPVHLLPRLESSGLRYVSWEPGDPIPEYVQALVCHREHLDLWYRLAPQTFMGGSLVPGVGGRAPLTASALGSAVLFGPYVESHSDAYTRLSDEGGAVPVHSASALAVTVVELAAPDKAAAMALAGWQVVTEGAALVDLLVELVQDKLDEQELRDARA